jgi:hypothetical protein
VRRHLGEDGLLDRHVFFDDLDHPVRLADARHVVVEVPDFDERRALRGEQRIGLGLEQGGNRGPCDAVADTPVLHCQSGGGLRRIGLARHDVEDDRGHPRIREMSRNGASHDARSQDRDLADVRFHRRLLPSKLNGHS